MVSDLQGAIKLTARTYQAASSKKWSKIHLNFVCRGAEQVQGLGRLCQCGRLASISNYRTEETRWMVNAAPHQKECLTANLDPLDPLSQMYITHVTFSPSSLSQASKSYHCRSPQPPLLYAWSPPVYGHLVAECPTPPHPVSPNLCRGVVRSCPGCRSRACQHTCRVHPQRPTNEGTPVCPFQFHVES